MNLTDAQIERYTHHIVLKDIGGEGQKKLLSSGVLIIGLGGLGSPAALYAAAAGIGTIGIIDDDKVELSNLQRQIIHTAVDIGKPKVVSAKEKILANNPETKVILYNERLSPDNASQIFFDYDFIIDGSDNFPTKFLINDTCVAAGKPFSYGGVVGFKGQTFTYTPGNMCARCVFTTEPDECGALDCRGMGILGTTAGVIGSIQAAEAVKFIIGKGELLTNRLFVFDALKAESRSARISRNRDCPVCSSSQDRVIHSISPSSPHRPS